MKLLSTAKAFGIAALLSTAATAGVIDDFSGCAGVQDGTTSDCVGYWAADTDQYSGGTSEVLLENIDGNLYPAGQGLDAAQCPGGEVDEWVDGQMTGNKVSACYWGWNTADAYTAEGFKSILRMSSYVNPTGWGWASAGWYYIANSTNFNDATPAGWSASTEFTATLSYDAGAQLTIFGYENDYIDDPNHNRPQMKITGTGSQSPYTFAIGDLQPASWATNTANPSSMIALGFIRLQGAASTGEAIKDTADKTLVISKLESSASSSLVNAAEGSLLDLQVTQEGLVYSNVTAQTTVEIFNMAGEQVASQLITGDQLVSTSELTNGAYIVRTAEQGKSAVSQRFVINK